MLLSKYYSGDKIKKGEIDGACGTDRRENLHTHTHTHTKLVVVNLKENPQLEKPGMDGITLNGP